MQVVSQRFPQNSIGAVGSAMFLRFINPAIVSPYEAGILDKKPPPRIERGLKLMSKVCNLMFVHIIHNFLFHHLWILMFIYTTTLGPTSKLHIAKSEFL